MNYELLETYWYPLVAQKRLSKKPLKMKLLGKYLVLVKLKGEIACFEDRCPHRNVPLSDGFVENNHLRCGYHGWAFNKQGLVTKIPGCQCMKEQITLKSYKVHIEDGIIWVCLKGNRAFKNPFYLDSTFDTQTHFKSLQSDFIHTIENFLDATHTPFIHKGLLRKESKQQRMEVTQELFDESFITHYTLLDKQNGLINSLFDKGININDASFVMPGFAQIDYRRDTAVLFRVSIFFVPYDELNVGMVVRVSIPKSIFSRIKFWLIRPFMELAFYQDKVILEKQAKMQKIYNKPYRNVQSDLVIDHLLYLFGEKEHSTCKKSTMVL